MKAIFVLGWLVTLNLVIWSAWQVKDLRTEYSVDQFYPKKHELLLSHDRIQKEFRLSEEQPFLYVLTFPREDSWVEPGKVERLRKLTSKLKDLPQAARVVALTEIEGASQEGEELVVGSLFDRVPPQHWRKAVESSPLLHPLLVSEDFRSTLIMIESSGKTESELSTLAEAARKAITEVFPDATLAEGGVPLLQSRLSTVIKNELLMLLLGGAILFSLLFYFLFRNLRVVAVALGSLLLSNLLALALLSFWKVPLNALLVTLPVIVSVSVMSLLIHTLHLWGKKGELQGEERFLGALSTMRELFLPNILGILTTALGFLAIAPSPIPLISTYGKTVALVLLVVSVFSELLLLLSLPHLSPRLRGAFEGPARWTSLPLRSPRLVLSVSALIFFLGILGTTELNFSLRLFDDLPRNDDLRKTTDYIDDSFGGILGYELRLESMDQNFWKSPRVLERLSELGKNLRALPGIRTVLGVSDFFQGKIPETEESVAESFFLFSLAENDPLRSFVTDDFRVTRLGIRLSDLASGEVEGVKKEVLALTRKAFPEIQISEGGMANYAHGLNQEVARALIFDFWQPLLLIGIFLIFIFRSFRWALIACLPNLLPPAGLIGAMALLGVSVKPGIALIYSIALGFAFNNTLYVLSRLRRCRGADSPLTTALLDEGNPCFLESLVMFTGFTLFLFSDFDMNQNFGGFMLLSIVTGFFADLFFLPALIQVFPGALAQREKKIPLTPGILGLLMTFPVLGASPEDILRESRTLLDARDDEATVEMVIIEKNGERKIRTLRLQSIREKGFSVLARIEAPADIKNMSFLGHVDEEGNEEQWIYLPSSGKVRRLVTGKTKGGLLGSEISPEDLNSQAVKGAKTRLLKTDKEYHWIEVTPSEGSSDYTRVVTKISKSDRLPKFTAYYTGNKIQKTIAFKDYKKFGPVFRAQNLVVQNHQNGRGTEVRLSDLKVNSGLSPDDFEVSRLKD